MWTRSRAHNHLETPAAFPQLPQPGWGSALKKITEATDGEEERK